MVLISILLGFLCTIVFFIWRDIRHGIKETIAGLNAIIVELDNIRRVIEKEKGV